MSLVRFALAAIVGLTLLVACQSREGSQSGPAAGHAKEAGHAEHDEHAEELRVTLAPEAIGAGGIETIEAGPAVIRLMLELPGEIAPNADRLAHIVPRFPGIAREARKTLGDPVRQGEVVAVIESNESLSLYDVTSLLSGTVIEKHITLGEFVRDDSDIYVIADLSTVWVKVTVYSRDLDKVRRGQRVEISAGPEGPRAEGTITYIGPGLGEATRAATARVVLPNPSLIWRPGLFVTARVIRDEPTVSIAVADSALQRIEGRTAVFVVEGSAFEVRFVEPGRTDGRTTEILSGLSVGERYVHRGAFLLKSELMKSEAGHEH
jgi:cobalt-zinc-cadmium efflux system membrane fusion protein